MAKFTRIEVVFPTENGERRAIVRPGKRVTAIFIGGSEATLIPRRTPRKSPPPETAVEIAPTSDVESDDGPQVCYLVGGQLHCW